LFHFAQYSWKIALCEEHNESPFSKKYRERRSLYNEDKECFLQSPSLLLKSCELNAWHEEAKHYKFFHTM